MGLLDIPICLLVFIFGINFKNKFQDLNKQDKKTLNNLFFFHVFIGVVFYFYIQTRGDALYYWMHPKDITFNELWNDILSRSYASDYIYLFNYFFSNTLNLSFFTGSMIYCMLGYIALTYFYVILKRVVPNYQFLSKLTIINVPVFPFFFFFPNLHFWSSGVGKDTLLFFCIALFIYSLINIKKNLINIILSIVLSIFVRPHITLFLITGFGLGYTLSGKLKSYQKVFIVSFFIVGFGLMFNYVLSFIQLESLDVNSIEAFANHKVKVLSSKSTSGVDTSSYPYPLKVLSYLYRPLFFDINNVIAIIASFENLFLLLLTLKIFKLKNIRYIKKADHMIKGGIIFLLIGTLTFSLILGNLGIMLREKNMFTPMFLIVAYWLLSVSKIKIKKNIQKTNYGN
jgi:hypothetical protein